MKDRNIDAREESMGANELVKNRHDTKLCITSLCWCGKRVIAFCLSSVVFLSL